jgi:hypothetical protein
MGLNQDNSAENRLLFWQMPQLPPSYSSPNLTYLDMKSTKTNKYRTRTESIKPKLFFRYPFLISALAFAVIILLSVVRLRL